MKRDMIAVVAVILVFAVSAVGGAFFAGYHWAHWRSERLYIEREIEAREAMDEGTRWLNEQTWAHSCTERGPLGEDGEPVDLAPAEQATIDDLCERVGRSLGREYMR